MLSVGSRGRNQLVRLHRPVTVSKQGGEQANRLGGWRNSIVPGGNFALRLVKGRAATRVRPWLSPPDISKET